ncbi:MAG: head-tail connector protein [Alphaproteobacteria bacterium]
MLLTELTTVASNALPVQALKDHLRLGTGFSDSGMQDGLIETYLRTAISAVEGRIGKTLITRRFRLRLEGWRDLSEQALPVAPVSAIVSLTLYDAANAATVVANSRYRLVQDTHRPKLVSVGYLLPTVPSDGRIEVVFDAGFGTTWAEVPSDLQQAVMMLAAQYYERRNQFAETQPGLPYPVQTLIERWRIVRVLGGGTA